MIYEAADVSSAPISQKECLKYIFRSHIPINVLYDVLDKICIKKEKYYLFDFNAFRLLQYHELYPEFSQKIIQAYKPSKQFFVTRPLTYNSFITILRHICRVNHVNFKTKFNYQHSLYNIDYYIHYGEHETSGIFSMDTHSNIAVADQKN